MSFLYPLFLAALAAVAVPILLHLFRRKTDVVVDFPAVRLLHKAPVEQQRRRRLRELILLALRVTALALLALAFARPYLPATVASIPAAMTVIALDTSLSMSAPGQWERAQEIARQAVRDAPGTHQLALLSFADGARMVVPPTTDRGGVLAAIDQVQPSAGGTRYRSALAGAAEAISSGQGSIVVVTDLQRAGWEASDEGAVPEGIDVTVAVVAAPATNIAVTSARRHESGIIAGIHNFGVRTARVAARLRIGDRDLATQPVEVQPQAAAEVRFAVALPAGGGGQVAIDDREGYVGDNVRYLTLDPPAALPIIIVTAAPPDSSNAGLYVERALSVTDDGRAFAPRVLHGPAFSALPPAEFESAAAVILLGTTTLDRAGRERVSSYLRSGGRVLLTLGPDVDLSTLADTLGAGISVDPDVAVVDGGNVTLVATDTRHPIFRPFTSPSGALGDVHVERYRRLKVQGNDGGPAGVLARFSGAGDALLERQVDQGRLLLFTSDLDNRWNRFPLSPAFVPWMIETARYLSEGRELRQQFTLPDVPPGVPMQAGIHQARQGTVVVNPDVRESNPVATSREDFLAGIAR